MIFCDSCESLKDWGSETVEAAEFLLIAWFSGNGLPCRNQLPHQSIPSVYGCFCANAAAFRIESVQKNVLGVRKRNDDLGLVDRLHNPHWDRQILAICGRIHIDQRDRRGVALMVFAFVSCLGPEVTSWKHKKA